MQALDDVDVLAVGIVQLEVLVSDVGRDLEKSLLQFGALLGSILGLLDGQKGLADLIFVGLPLVDEDAHADLSRLDTVSVHLLDPLDYKKG